MSNLPPPDYKCDCGNRYFKIEGDDIVCPICGSIIENQPDGCSPGENEPIH